MLGKINSFHSTLAWKFANFHIPSLQIFFSKKHVVGFVNLKPAVPGHVLVSPRRHVQRLKDLDTEETKHLWLGVAEVQRVIEEKYKRNSHVVIQDGVDAGQTVPHLHVHIYPEYEDGEINIQESEKRSPRDLKSMAEEADEYRKHFSC